MDPMIGALMGQQGAVGPQAGNPQSSALGVLMSMTPQQLAAIKTGGCPPGVQPGMQPHPGGVNPGNGQIPLPQPRPMSAPQMPGIQAYPNQRPVGPPMNIRPNLPGGMAGGNY